MTVRHAQTPNPPGCSDAPERSTGLNNLIRRRPASEVRMPPGIPADLGSERTVCDPVLD